MKKTLLDIITAHSGVSSKRVCGILGWLICLIIMCCCAYTNKQAPDITETIVITSAALLGVDSVTGIWKNKHE